MTLRIIGDEIEFEGFAAGRIRSDLPVSVRDRFVDLLAVGDADLDEIYGEAAGDLNSEITALTEENERLGAQIESLEDENDALKEKLAAAGVEGAP